MKQIIGSRFIANDKKGSIYSYEIIGINPYCDMRKFILWNFTTLTTTEVGQNWFDVRIIKWEDTK